MAVLPQFAVCEHNPVNDSREVTEYILSQAAKADLVRVLPGGGHQ